MKFDRSDCTVLAVCDECSWVELVSTLDIAHRVGLDHLWRAHPSSLTAINTVHKRLERRRRVAEPNASGVTRTVS